MEDVTPSIPTLAPKARAGTGLGGPAKTSLPRRIWGLSGLSQLPLPASSNYLLLPL